MIPAETLDKARDKSVLDVARQCGAELRKVGAEWNGPCPACGGRDRFWVNEAKNTFLCRMSGVAGNAIALLRHKHGCSFTDAVEMLTGEKAMPASTRRPPQSAEQENAFRDKARQRAWGIWRNGHPADPARGGRLVHDYLALRGIPFPSWHLRSLREIDTLDYWHWSKTRREHVRVHRGPAMLAAITGDDGRFIGVHRTWIDLDHPSGKAVIADPETGEILGAKKVEGSQRGGRIVLREGKDGGDLALGEGIETLLSWATIRCDDNAALWCGINLDNIAGKAAEQIPHPSLTATDALGRTRRQKVGGHEPRLDDIGCLQIPPGVFARVVLPGDSDSDRFTTQAAMQRARKRIDLSGTPAVIDWAPDGQDFNDVLRARVSHRRPAREVA